MYVDVLIVTNFLINYALLSLMSRLAGRTRIRIRLVGGALIGAIFALTIFVPQFSWWQELGCKVVSSGLMVAVANKFTCLRETLKEWLLLFGVTALFGGLMMAVWVTIVPSFMLYANGVVYFHFSPLLLIINITAAYVIVCLADRLFRSTVIGEGTYEVVLSLFGNEKKMIAFLDTGNRLVEPFSNAPVAICGIEDIREIFPNRVTGAIRAYFETGEMLDFPAEYQTSLRMIPYQGVDAMGILPAIRGERLEVITGKESAIVENFYIAVSLKQVGGNGCQMLLGQDMICTGGRRQA